MTQVADMVIAANPSGLAMRTKINDIFEALNTLNKGSTAPTSLDTGTAWIDDANDPIWSLKVYDGSTSIQFVKINTTDNIFVFDGIEFESVQAKVNTITSTANAITVDCNNGVAFKHVMTESTTFTFSNPAASGKLTAFTLFLDNAAGAYTPTWPGAVKWSNGSAPVFAVASKKYMVGFTTIDGGTTWVGTLCSEAYA